MDLSEHLASGFFVPILKKDVQVQGDKLIRCKFFSGFPEERYILVFQHSRYTSSMPSIPASKRTLGALSLGVVEPDTVSVIAFLTAS